ncbi:MAG: TlpA disulfide reductase family protein [Acidobacteriota bacterium]
MAEVETNPEAAEPEEAGSEIEPYLPVPNTRPGLGREAKLAFAVVAAFVVFALFGPTGESNKAPDGVLLDAAGGEVDLFNVLAPVTLVHFWSTWCPPCITETPSIQRLAESYRQHREFALVMVAVADENDKVSEFLGAANATLYDPDWDVAKSYGTDKLPETHLVVRGQLVESFIGAVDWDNPEVRAVIDNALASTREGGASGEA